ncbi:hypothetical protein [Wenzhouxiangella marina]|uniref:Uncharacterized protein n=1 Tax=Wenzhouxiangella marina TaxID=1579979 RepID=A0A0K0XUD4_9GAMM|nr:hypothetical protein [Wenzhouxiangella marina]AKS41232.1 hypothetical protein WM2015_851 [Wenzhouxiangella marina]MBB6088112.1 hypothetical protein [Wenzhouxiangella marina]
MIRNSLLIAFILAVSSGPSLADEALPSARSLVDAHIEAAGGRDAIEAQADSTMTGRLRMPSAGLEGQLKLVSRQPGERVMQVELPGIGTIQSGYRDGTAWSVDPFMGPRLIEGQELAAQVEANEIGAILRSEEYVESMETVEQREYDGQACYAVEVRWKSGRESLDCYAVDSGLLLASESTEQSPMGEMETVMIFSDYQRFGDSLLPALTRLRTMGQEQHIVIDSVEFGPPEAANFELPPAIVTLMSDNSAD